jgi:8-oxo-dGTP diphosphatase
MGEGELMDKRFNIRVYGIWINEDKLLINEELIRGRKVVKLPGGGLDWGEGIKDCLIREWKEELGLDIELLSHFYTTDFFQQSAFDDSQIISIYYTVRPATPLPEGWHVTNKEPNEEAKWIDLAAVSADTFTLAIDQVVGAMIAGHHSS